MNNISGPTFIIFLGALISACGAVWASIEIAKLNRQISDSITGGDSFPYFVPSFNAGSNFPGSLTILSKGEHTIYDLSYRVTDLDDFEAAQHPYSVGVEKSVRNLPPNTAMLSGLRMREKDFTRLTVQLSSRNNQLIQEIRIKKIGVEYKTALRVRNIFPPNETIFIKIDDGYPLNSEGEVEW